MLATAGVAVGVVGGTILTGGLGLSLLTLGAHGHARVTVLGVCINESAYLNVKNICEDLPKTTAFERYAAKHERKRQLLITLAYPWSAFSA